MKPCYLGVILSLALSGCASSGPRIDAARLAEVRKGETTVSEVMRRFGRPNVLSKNMDGTQTAAYLHAEGRSEAAALVPALGALMGNAEADVDSVIFSFDTRGVLRDYKTTQARAEAPAVVADSAAPASPATTASSVARPMQPEKKASPVASRPWTETWRPVRQVENR